MPAISDAEFKLLQRSVHNQRYQMELTLETMPREVYSNQLMEAMRREEMAVRDGVRITQDMTKGIDDMLRAETRKFYQKISAENARRWMSLHTKVETEYSRFHQGSRSGKRGEAAGAGAGASVGKACTAEAHRATPSPTPSSSVSAKSVASETGTGTAAVAVAVPALTMADMQAEVGRLEENYQRQWLQYELGNLQCAFASQMDRVESEWSSHEQSLTEDYNRKKISEKMGHNRQKESSSPSANLAKKQFNHNLEHLQVQKAASQRWMSRQEIRLTAQATEMAPERAKIADFLASELRKTAQRAGK